MSFFGFDTSKPVRGNERAGAANGGGGENEGIGGLDEAGMDGLDGSRLDSLLEERFKYGTYGGEQSDDVDGLLLEDDDDLNDETFGGSGADVGTDFDFTAGASFPVESDDFFASTSKGPISPVKTSGHAVGSSGPKMMSLEEIEAQMMSNRHLTQPPLQQSQHSQPIFNQQFQPPGFGGPPQFRLANNQFPPAPQAGLSIGSQFGDRRILSVTEIEEGLLQQKQQQQHLQQHMSHTQQPLQVNHIGSGPPGHPQFQQGHPVGFAPLQHMNPPVMGPPGMMVPSGSPPHHHPNLPQFNGPPMGGPMLQNQIFPPAQQFQQPGAPRSFHGSPIPLHPPATGNQPLSTSNQQNLPQDEMLRNAQLYAQQQHQMQMQQQQQRGGGRGEYGAMRYNNVQAMNNRKNVLMHTGFSSEDNPQRGASGKGPGAFDGGWSMQSNRTPRWIRYADSMTQYEKETIAKIQIAQLVSESPFRDDFYYQIYNLFKSSVSDVGIAGANWQQTVVNQGKDTSDMQAQMKKLIEGKKIKQKGTTLALEGALGKISLTSVKNPRQLIQINQAAKENHSVPTFSRLTRRKILKSIEKVYTCILNLEQLKRKPPTVGVDDEAWNADSQQNIAELWEELSLNDNIPFTLPHPFPYFLSYSKGKKAFSRLVPYLTPDQMFAALSTLFSRAESLDVCNMPAGSQDEAIELFASTVVPTLVSFISEVPLQVVNAFLRILLERHNMVWLAKSKAGLAFLALLLSRAEILKQGGGLQQGLRPPGADDLALWTELYNFLFASLEGNFAAIFPPTPSPDALDTSKPADEVYIWQFLAAMAVGATSADHQRVLLTEVRDKIFETSRRGSGSENPEDVRALTNVNLFLNALGLGIDASQLANM
ncbi:hypothetical protein HDU78_002676 [Chytriomyces hyalinus]|nr:hypothetical protein HDU78_002676 [Chytriomyces hyalinus]